MGCAGTQDGASSQGGAHAWPHAVRSPDRDEGSASPVVPSVTAPQLMLSLKHEENGHSLTPQELQHNPSDAVLGALDVQGHREVIDYIDGLWDEAM